MLIPELVERRFPISRERLRISKEAISLTFIFLCGLLLRLYQLGRDSFWYDEVVIAWIAQLSSFAAVLQKLQAPGMMPLDMLVNWAVARLSQSEAILRLPSALFGSLGILAAYALFRQLGERRAAVLTAGLLAIAPLHVLYSQELRFYAALVFFYCLSAALLLRVLQRPSLSGWIVYTLLTIVGIYFHVYVLLAGVLGGVWLLFHWNSLRPSKSLLAAYALSQVVMLVAFVPGYLYFGTSQNFTFPLSLPGSSVLRDIGLGLGWIEIPFWEGFSAGWIWTKVCFFFAIVGLLDGLISRKKLALIVVVSGAIQITGIILADILRHYWFFYRQILALMPQALLLTALGILATGDWLARLSRAGSLLWQNRLAVGAGLAPAGLTAGNRQAVEKREMGYFEQARATNTLVLAILLLMVGSLALLDYYHWQKSSAGETASYLAEAWSPGETILVLPGYEWRTIYFYLFRLRRPEVAAAITLAEWDRLPDLEAASIRWIVVAGPIGQEWRAALAESGFQPVQEDPGQGWLGHTLFMKNISSSTGP